MLFFAYIFQNKTNIFKEVAFFRKDPFGVPPNADGVAKNRHFRRFGTLDSLFETGAPKAGGPWDPPRGAFKIHEN